MELHGDLDLTFAYVPTHLHQMLFELLKNSLRAVQDRHINSDKAPPPIKVIIAEGGEGMTQIYLNGIQLWLFTVYLVSNILS